MESKLPATGRDTGKRPRGYQASRHKRIIITIVRLRHHSLKQMNRDQLSQCDVEIWRVVCRRRSVSNDPRRPHKNYCVQLLRKCKNERMQTVGELSDRRAVTIAPQPSGAAGCAPHATGSRLFTATRRTRHDILPRSSPSADHTKRYIDKSVVFHTPSAAPRPPHN